MSKRHALIVGGGIGGLTASLMLANKGWLVSVFEQATELSDIGAGIQLTPNCTRVLHHLGLAEKLQAVSNEPDGIEMRHWQSGDVISNSALGAAARLKFSFPYLHIHRADLISLLVEAANAESSIDLYTDTKVSSIAQDGSETSLTLSNGEIYRGEIIIGADGIRSVVREHLFGSSEPRFTGNVAWRALISSDKLPEAFVKPNVTAWWGPGAHFVHYYVRSGELVNCVCVVEKQGWEVESWTEPGQISELKHDFKNWHPSIQMLVDKADRDSLFKWALHDRRPMRSWGKGRVTLLGDACHPTLPFMAQGAAMAVEDAAVLANCLANWPIDDAIDRYENLRKRRTADVQNGSRRNARIFHMKGVKAWLRDIAAKTVPDRAFNKLFSYDALTAHESM